MVNNSRRRNRHPDALLYRSHRIFDTVSGSKAIVCTNNIKCVIARNHETEIPISGYHYTLMVGDNFVDINHRLALPQFVSGLWGGNIFSKTARDPLYTDHVGPFLCNNFGTDRNRNEVSRVFFAAREIAMIDQMDRGKQDADGDFTYRVFIGNHEMDIFSSRTLEQLAKHVFDPKDESFIAHMETWETDEEDEPEDFESEESEDSLESEESDDSMDSDDLVKTMKKLDDSDELSDESSDESSQDSDMPGLLGDDVTEPLMLEDYLEQYDDDASSPNKRFKWSDPTPLFFAESAATWTNTASDLD